jgi:hypothetical protein
MKNPLLISILCLAAVGSAADDVATTPSPSPSASASALAQAQARAARPRQALPAAPAAAADSAATDKAVPAADAPSFVSEAKWGLAGYNNNEVYYTVFVTNQDKRILRCTTQIQGMYVNNGEKASITDRQITTVFPDQPTQVGIWMDMDEGSGATYSVKCHRI